MILIAHRGNLTGPNPQRENHPDYVAEALALGFDVEVDVWAFQQASYVDWWYGHDDPTYQAPKTGHICGWPKESAKRIWFHCKNLLAFEALLLMQQTRRAESKHPVSDLHAFWHQKDDYALTTCGFIWTYPGMRLSKGSICVMPEFSNSFSNKAPLTKAQSECYGICSDYVESIRDVLA